MTKIQDRIDQFNRRHSSVVYLKAGDCVRYTRADNPERTCLGTIVKILPGFTDTYREGREPCEQYTVDDCAIVEVMNPVPDWWAYPDTRRFAPDLTELKRHS